MALLNFIAMLAIYGSYKIKKKISQISKLNYTIDADKYY